MAHVTVEVEDIDMDSNDELNVSLTSGIVIYISNKTGHLQVWSPAKMLTDMEIAEDGQISIVSNTQGVIFKAHS